jgi:hypothetical protein
VARVGGDVGIDGTADEPVDLQIDGTLRWTTAARP